MVNAEFDSSAANAVQQRVQAALATVPLAEEAFRKVHTTPCASHRSTGVLGTETTAKMDARDTATDTKTDTETADTATVTATDTATDTAKTDLATDLATAITTDTTTASELEQSGPLHDVTAAVNGSKVETCDVDPEGKPTDHDMQGAAAVATKANGQKDQEQQVEQPLSTLEQAMHEVIKTAQLGQNGAKNDPEAKHAAGHDDSDRDMKDNGGKAERTTLEQAMCDIVTLRRARIGRR